MFSQCVAPRPFWKNLQWQSLTIATNTRTCTEFPFCLSLRAALFCPLILRKNINKIVNMPKINRENYTIECFFECVWNRNWCPDHESSRAGGETELNECCSCLSIADQWRLKNSTKGMKKQFSLNRMSSENEEFSQMKWNFPRSLLFRCFQLADQRAVLLCKHRYESAVFQLASWNWLLSFRCWLKWIFSFGKYPIR